MNLSHSTLRGTAVAAAAAVIITATAHGAPKKPAPVPAPAIEQTVPKKKGMFGKLKSALGSKEKEATPVAEPKPVGKVKPVENERGAAVSKVKAPAKLEAPKMAVVEEKPATQKKGFFKKMFTREKEEAPAEPTLAKAKTAKPAPVKGVKPVEKLTLNSAEEPKKKRGLFGFLRGGGSKSWDEEGMAEIPEADKIVRPADWQEHRVVQDDEIALYSFGPAQPQGPDERLSRGTLVRVKKVTKGWALVEVNGGRSGYIDASMLRATEMNDFADPPAPAMASLGSSLEPWAPAAPPPDLPDQPGAMDNSGALLLLPPLELEPKP